MVGEIKKQRYVYYHCTGYADKCQSNPASCRRRYVREEFLEQQFTTLLGQPQFDVHASHADKRQEQEEAITRLRAEWDRLQKRLSSVTGIPSERVAVTNPFSKLGSSSPVFRLFRLTKFALSNG